jgi:imidazolonepropionase-like amidohydrolase
MKVLIAFFVLLAAAVPMFGQPAAIENVTVINVETGALMPNQTVRIEGNTIAAVGPAASVSVPASARRIDGRGKFLIPGLWQMHGHDMQHYGIDYGSRMAPFQLFIANGVTGLRDMGSTLDQLFLGKKRIAELKVPATRIFGAGPLLHGTEPSAPAMSPLVINIGSPDEGRLIVDALALTGVDLLKIHGDMTPETYYAVAAEAKVKNIPFAGHLPAGVNILEASDAGQISIEHIAALSPMCVREQQIDVPRCQAVLEKLRANGTFWGPTLIGALPLTAGHPNVSEARWGYIKAKKRATFPKYPNEATPQAKAAFEIGQRLTRMAAEAGVRMIASSDTAGGTRISGFSAVDELILMAEAGVKPLAVLQAGTLNPVLLLKRERSLGTIAVGKLADLVLLDGDPLADIHNLRRVSAVVADGRIFDSAQRQALFDAVLKDAGDPN